MDLLVGKVTHYYRRLGVAVLLLTDGIKIGDTLLFLGHTTEFFQAVSSIEVEHRKILSASGGAEVAVKVDEPVRRGDLVYRVAESEKILFG
jgi:putative protease